MELDIIHDSLLNGQRRQAVDQINEYCLEYDFWEDYKRYLKEFYDTEQAFKYFTDLTISYFRINNR